MEGNLLYSKPADLNVNLFFKKNTKTFIEISRKMFDQVPGYHGLAKLTCNNNHHPLYTGSGALMHSAQQPHQKAFRALWDLVWTPFRSLYCQKKQI